MHSGIAVQQATYIRRNSYAPSEISNKSKSSHTENNNSDDDMSSKSKLPTGWELLTKSERKAWKRKQRSEERKLLKEKKLQEERDEKKRAKEEKKQEAQLKRRKTSMKYNKKRGTYVVSAKGGVQWDDLLQSDIARTIASNMDTKSKDDESDDDDEGYASVKSNKMKDVDPLRVYPKQKNNDSPSKQVIQLLQWCKEGKRKKVENSICGSIVSKGVNIHVSNEYGHTPLLIASSYGHHRLVRGLLALGADANQADNVGGTPLHHASLGGHTMCIKSLLNGGADVACVDMKKCSPLHYAVEYGHWEVVAILLQVGTQTINWQDSSGFTPLMRAMSLPAEDNTLDIIDILSQNGADFDARNKAGSDVMYVASKNRALYPLVLTVLKERNPKHALAVKTSRDEERRKENEKMQRQREREETLKVKYEDTLLVMAAESVGALIATTADVVREEYVPPREVVQEVVQEDESSSESDDSLASDISNMDEGERHRQAVIETSATSKLTTVEAPPFNEKREQEPKSERWSFAEMFQSMSMIDPTTNARSNKTVEAPKIKIRSVPVSRKPPHLTKGTDGGTQQTHNDNEEQEGR